MVSSQASQKMIKAISSPAFQIGDGALVWDIGAVETE